MKLKSWQTEVFIWHVWRVLSDPTQFCLFYYVILCKFAILWNICIKIIQKWYCCDIDFNHIRKPSGKCNLIYVWYIGLNFSVSLTLFLFLSCFLVFCYLCPAGSVFVHVGWLVWWQDYTETAEQISTKLWHEDFFLASFNNVRYEQCIYSIFYVNFSENHVVNLDF